MNWPTRILIIFLIIFITLFAGLYYFGLAVLPIRSNNIKYQRKDQKEIEYNSDKIDKVISTITSSTPSSLLATSSQYITMPSRYNIPPTGKVIYANLDKKTIDIIEDGVATKTINIVSIGKPNKYYETPGGIYKIKSWETRHYSSLGHVYMPWSMQFSGNYFIHGIPYHEDGERVSTQYSGGCIRLEDTDAEYIYNFSDKSTYVIVSKSEDAKDEMSNIDESSIKDLTSKLKAQHKYYYVMDLSNNLYYSNFKNLNESIENSNMIYLGTALTSLDNISQERNITYQGSTDRQLVILPSLLTGEPEAYKATTHILGTGLFQALLNNKMRSVGLEDTTIDIDSKNSTTTLVDMMYTLRYIYIYKPYIMSLNRDSDNTKIWKYDLGKGYNSSIMKGIHRYFLIITQDSL